MNIILVFDVQYVDDGEKIINEYYVIIVMYRTGICGN